MAAALTIHQVAARCALVLERTRQLFELVGHWSATAPHDVMRITLARVATHAATHMEWWTQRQPHVDGALDDADEVLSGHAHWEAALRALADQGPTSLGLQGVAELLGRWIDEFAQWASQHDPDLDAPTVRVLELVLADLQRDRDDLLTVAG
jgi:hypothetical protein